MADRVSYRNLLVGAYEYFQSDMMNKLVANQPKTHLQTITNQMKTKSINYGDIRLNNIRKYLDQFPGYTRCVLCYYFYYFSNCALTLFIFLQVGDAEEVPWIVSSGNYFFYYLLLSTLSIDTNPFFILQAVALHLYRDDPEVSTYYNVLFYNHCIELTPFFFLFTGGYGQVNFECNLFSLFFEHIY